MKARAARIWMDWHRARIGSRIVKSSGSQGKTFYTAEEIRAAIGKTAAMHGTHVCGMCNYEKRMGIPHIRSHESIRIHSF